jgi:hypothetical protein
MSFFEKAGSKSLKVEIKFMPYEYTASEHRVKKRVARRAMLPQKVMSCYQSLKRIL